MSASDEAGEAVLAPGHTFASVTDKISSIVLTRPPSRRWWYAVTLAFSLVLLLLFGIGRLLAVGIGIWGNNVPVAWAFDIINFVWWVGIGHAGTFISAILLLVRQEWRTSINRFAEAMTLFAVICAALFPLLHLGRPQYFYWLFPYPNTMAMWPQFRSPLEWDVFAVSTYATVSLLFWYVGLVPDFAVLRDRAQKKFPQIVYGFLAMGWRGSAIHWRRYESAYLLLAGIATPLVISVHTIVSLDFAVGQVPGWHVTLFPPYFVAGAIFSGFAMVITLAIPLRAFFGLEDFITMKHLENSAKLLLTTGLIVAYGYGMETFTAWYSANTYEAYVTLNRFTGPYAPAYYALLFCNIVAPQLLWFRRFRLSLRWLFALSIIVNIGMWLERFVIIVGSLHRDFLPSSWRMYSPTLWDWAFLAGTLGLFAFLLLLFVRLLPLISISEMQKLIDDTRREREDLGYD
jgi:Ni/Fe-hydrogenase subunit HybB-like protein